MLTRVCLTATLLCFASALPQIGHLNTPGRVPGEYLVVLQPTPKAQRAAYVNQAVSRIQSISSSIHLIRKMEALESPILHFQADEAAIRLAFDIPEVVSIEADVFEQMIEQQDCECQDTGSTYWGLSRISVEDMPSFPNAQYCHRIEGGQGVKVYILDTGIRLSHEDFSGGRAIWGTNMVPNTGDNDLNGHGTHCAGTAVGANSGVAKGATAIAVKVLGDSGSGAHSGVVAGIYWAVGDVATGERAVITMSLGGSGSDGMESAIDSAYSAGIPVAAAAGNNFGDACGVGPSRYRNSISVASSDNQDRLSSFSNFGVCVNITAPGSSIRSSSHLSDNQYRVLSGTSMAAPHVAGAAALILFENPGYTASQVTEALTSGASEDKLELRDNNTPNLLLRVNCS